MFNVSALAFPFLFNIPGLSALSGLGEMFASPPRFRDPSQLINGLILETDPPILFFRPQPKPFGAAHHFAARFPESAPIFLVPITMSMERRSFALSLAVQYRRFRRTHPTARLIMMANTHEEERLLRNLGVEARFIPQNMFIDETMYWPIPERKRTVDAIYNAQLAPFKRHHLARMVPSCAYVTKFFGSFPPNLRRKQLAAFVDALPDGHTIVNDVTGEDIAPMVHVQVNEAMASAHVGLCLSKVEGAMYASTEYLLAGLPVVSTRSRGGRDTFFHPDTALIVDDDPRAVRDGVAAMKARALPPDFVRATTLGLIREQREAFNAFIDALRGRTAERADPRWSFNYYPSLSQVRPLGDVEDSLRRGLENRKPSIAPAAQPSLAPVAR